MYRLIPHANLTLTSRSLMRAFSIAMLTFRSSRQHRGLIACFTIVLAASLPISYSPAHASAKQWIKVSKSFVVDYNSIRVDGNIRTVEVLNMASTPSVSLFKINCLDFEFSVAGQISTTSWRPIPGGSAVHSIAALICP